MAEFVIESEARATNSHVKDLFEFIGDFKNFPTILPKDKVEDFRYSGNECSFNIKGITEMTVQMEEKKPYEYILFTSSGLGKYTFQLKVFFEGGANEQGECRVELHGDLNPIIKSMAEKPLGKLVDAMSLKLSELQLS